VPGVRCEFSAPAVRGDRGVHHVGTMGGSYTRDQRWAIAGKPSWLKVKPQCHSSGRSTKIAGIVGITRESGSGKSTIARSIAGLYHPTAGSITLGGALYWLFSSSVRRYSTFRRTDELNSQYRRERGGASPRGTPASPESIRLSPCGQGLRWLCQARTYRCCPTKRDTQF